MLHEKRWERKLLSAMKTGSFGTVVWKQVGRAMALDKLPIRTEKSIDLTWIWELKRVFFNNMTIKKDWFEWWQRTSSGKT